MSQPPPDTYTAFTRAGKLARFRRLTAGEEVHSGDGERPYILMGYLEGRTDEPELWTVAGHWLNTGEEHPNDLIFE